MFHFKTSNQHILACAEVEVKQRQFPVYSYRLCLCSDTCIFKGILPIKLAKLYTLVFLPLSYAFYRIMCITICTSMRMAIKSILIHSFSPTLSTLGSSCRTTQGCCEKNLNHSILCNSLHLRFIFYPEDALLHYHLQLIISLQLGLWC